MNKLVFVPSLFGLITVLACGSTSSAPAVDVADASGTPADASPPSDDARTSDGGAQDAARGPKRVFVSSSQFPKDVARLGGGDSLCTSLANGARLGGTWRAWLSTSRENAIDHVVDVGPWYLVDGRTLAVSGRAQLAGQPAHVIDVTELGERLDPSSLGPRDLVVTTGTNSGGTVASTCSDWTSRDSNQKGTYGFLDQRDTWTSFAEGGCDSSNGRIYCFEQ